MKLIKKTTASLALVALTSGMLVNGTSAYSQAEVAAAELLASKGIVVKQSNAADYQLDRQVLRQEIAAVSRGLANLEKTTTCTNLFKDVSATKPNTWACYTVEALANAGLIAKNATFRPESNITKAEAVGMVVKARYGNEYNPVAGNGSWEKQVVDFAVSKGIVSNFTNYTTPATRGFVFEVAAKTYGEDDGSKILCELFGTCTTTTTTTEPKKEEPTKVVNNGELMVKASASNPTDGSIITAGVPRTVLLAFDVTAGKSDVNLKKANLKFTGLGDSDIVTNLAIYSDNVKLTKNDGTFNSKLTSSLSFDKDAVIKAGETKTLLVTAEVKPNTTYNQLVRIELTGLETSGTVSGDKVSGSNLNPYLARNVAKISVDTFNDSGSLFVGQEGVLYTLSVKETEKKEDVIVKSISVKKAGSTTADLDNLSDLSLYMNGTKVDAKFTIKKEKIVATLDQKIKANEKATFTIKGQMIDDLNESLNLTYDEVFAVGANTNIAASADVESNVEVTRKTIEGSAVNFVFNQATKETSANSTDVNLGELVFTTNTDYTADITLKISGTAASKISNVELDDDRVTGTNEFKFTNVQLAKGTTKLPITADVASLTTNKETFNVEVIVTRLEDDSLSDDIANLNKVLSSNNTTKYYSIVKSGLTLTAEQANITRVVPKGNQEVVLYRGYIDVNGGEDVRLENLVLTSTSNVSDLSEYVSRSTLNIGGKTFNGDVNNSNINFNSIYATIAKGSKSVQVLVTATLKDKTIANGTTVQLKVAPTSITGSSENAKGNLATIDTVGYNTIAQGSTYVNLESKPTINVVNINNQVEDNVVASTKNIALAAFKLRDTSADIYVNELSIPYTVNTVAGLTNSGDLTSALSNIRLMEGTNVIASGGKIKNGKVTFENFTLPQSGVDRTINLVADIASINTAGGETESFVGSVKFELANTNILVDENEASIFAFGTVSSEEVVILPAKSVFTVSDELGVNDPKSTVKLTIDTASNTISNLQIKSLNFDGLTNAQITSLTINGSEQVKNGTIDLTNINYDVTNLKEFNIQLVMKTANADKAVTTLRDIEFTYTTNNDTVVKSFKSVNKDTAVLGVYSVSQ